MARPTRLWPSYLRFWRRRRTLGLWYHKHYEPPSLEAASHLIGLVPNRIDLLLGKLVQDKLIRASDVRPSPSATFEDLNLVHSANYIESTARLEVVSRIFGHELDRREFDELIRAQRRTVGGTVAAALAVARGEVNVGFNLGGGFHHAEAQKGSGFCVYNDVAIAIARLRAAGFHEPVAIIDLDFHQGNGNLEIFAQDPSVLTYSLHGAEWSATRAINDVGVLLPAGADDRMYLEKLRETLMPTVEPFRPRIIFYIAGNDVLGGDRMGNFALTPKGVLRRDRHVIRCAETLGAPLVITLGGGYSPMAWQCTANLLTLLLTGEAIAAPRWEPDLRVKFSQISRAMEASLVQEEPSGLLNINEAEILGDLSRLARPRGPLEHYSVDGIEYAFERYGILQRIRDHGFSDFKFELDTVDPDRQIIRIRGRRASAPQESRQLLLEIVVNFATLNAPPISGIPEDLRFLSVKWLLIQDPEAGFSSERPRLPGQSHPGLGIAEHIQEFLVQFCRRYELDGILTTPSHFHNASVASRWFRFLDPRLEGRLLAMRQVLVYVPLFEASRAVEEGRLRLGDGTPLKWEPADQILPVSPRLQSYFEGDPYRLGSIAECQRLLKAGLQLRASAPSATG